jgi:hypothetical protein
MRGWGVGLLCGLLLPAAAEGQTAGVPGRFEVAAGVFWAGASPAGAAEATETAPGGSRFRLFTTESSLRRTTGLEGRFGVRLTPGLQLEASVSHATRELQARISADAEGVPATTLAETLDQWLVEGAIVAHFARWRIGSRGTPFLSAGAGYLRHVHEEKTLADTGRTYQVGGGVSFLLNQGGGGRLKGAGVRLGARAAVRTGGATFDDRRRVSPQVDASFFARF